MAEKPMRVRDGDTVFVEHYRNGEPVLAEPGITMRSKLEDVRWHPGESLDTWQNAVHGQKEGDEVEAAEGNGRMITLKIFKIVRPDKPHIYSDG